MVASRVIGGGGGGGGGGGRMIWSLQRGRSLLGEVVNRSFTVCSSKSNIICYLYCLLLCVITYVVVIFLL